MRFAKLLLVLVGVAGAIYLLQKEPVIHTDGTAQAAQGTPETFDPQTVLNDALALEREWKAYKRDKKGMPPSIVRVYKLESQLGEIPTDWAKADEAEGVLRRLRAEDSAISNAEFAAREAERLKIVAAKAKALADDDAGRKAFASELEKEFLRKGMDVTITTEAEKASVLRFKYILVNRPAIFQLQEDGTFLKRVRERGFRKLIMTDGYDRTWTWDFTKNG